MDAKHSSKVNPEAPAPGYPAMYGASPMPSAASLADYSAPPGTAPPPYYESAPTGAALPPGYSGPPGTMYSQPAYPRAQYAATNPQYVATNPHYNQFYALGPNGIVTTQPMMIAAPVPCNEKDYRAYSIFNIVCCCWILGIVALMASRETREANHRGDAVQAQQCSRKALRMNNLALVLGFLVNGAWIAYIIYIIVTATQSVQSSSSSSSSSYIYYG